MSMTLLLAIGISLAAVGALDALALRYGAESRPGFDEKSPLS
jgi:hypothetical protein